MLTDTHKHFVETANRWDTVPKNPFALTLVDGMITTDFETYVFDTGTIIINPLDDRPSEKISGETWASDGELLDLQYELIEKYPNVEGA